LLGGIGMFRIQIVMMIVRRKRTRSQCVLAFENPKGL